MDPDYTHFGLYGCARYAALTLALTDPEVDGLIALKRKYGIQREQLIAQQKQAGKAKDYDLARELKPQVAELLKLERAICLFLGHLGPVRGDAPYKHMKDWGKELVPACERINAYVLYPSILQEELQSD